MSLLERVWYERGIATTVRTALWPLSRGYGLLCAARNAMYDAGALHSTLPELPVISVGNLTVGGTGKTPVAAWLAARLQERANPAIVLRGYGADEIAVHERLNPGIPVVANRNRLAAIREARTRGADVAVLDDAFQHRRVRRTADVLLLSVEQLLRPRHLLPSGPWREPLRAAMRADLIMITRKSASMDEGLAVEALVRTAAPLVPTMLVRLEPKALVNAVDGTQRPLSDLAGAAILVIAAVGEPEVFRRQVEQAGASTTLAAFRDHHEYTSRDACQLAERVPRGGFAVCTLKDAVKLSGKWPGRAGLWYVSQRLAVEQEENPGALDRLVTRVLDSRTPTATTGGHPGASHVLPRHGN